MTEKKKLPVWRLVLSFVFLGVGTYIGLMVLLLSLFISDYLKVTVPVLYVALLAALVLVTAGMARKKWCRYLLAGLGTIALGCGVIIGLGVYDDNIPTLDDRSLVLHEYRPFTGEKTTALLEESTLHFTQEQADSFVIDGATALYPVYAAFVQAVYPEGVYQPHDYGYEGKRETVLCNGTTDAYRDLIAGEVDVIFAAEPSEKQLQAAADAGVQLHLTPIGREAFVFFVNSANPVMNLTFEQVAGIYAGEITNWKAVGGKNASIRPFQRDEGSGSQTALQKVMMMSGKTLMPAEKEEIVGAMDTIIRVTSYKNYSNAIGFTFRFYANEMVANDQIRLLSLNGVAPTKETIRDGSYPIASFFYAVTASPMGEPAPEETNEALGAFLKWCQGPQGQWLVEQVGYVTAIPHE